MKQRYVIIIILAALILLIGVIAGMFAQPPTATVSGASIRSINLSAIDLEITARVESSYPVTIPVKNVEYTVNISSVETPVQLAHGSQQGFTIKPGVQEISIPVIIQTASLPGAAVKILMSDELPLQISETVTLDIFGFAPVIEFNRTMTIPVPVSSYLSRLGSLII
ncbi:MAG TPA: LEA type 2 family protein [Methanospirillum sp.]|nr:LEA type 2 family protein [Methanospirillum sp.]